jgi:GAF domain-containing protein
MDRLRAPDALLHEISSIIQGSESRETKLQRICTLLEREVPHYDWVGFYLVDPDAPRELVLGPYVGAPTEHTRIPFGKGICGQAAETETTFIVQDISKETNYLSCSPEVRSEIVLPIVRSGEVIGELDIDSHALAPFTDADRALLERVCDRVATLF